LLKPSRIYFHFYKKGFVNSKAVRIRVKRADYHYFAPSLYILGMMLGEEDDEK
jgi:hypothetical protein